MQPRPIFVVGAPRSGTSILTWCLGQHADILPMEESDWLGPFAEYAGVSHLAGCARGERSALSALGIEADEFFAALGAGIDRIILAHRAQFQALSRAAGVRDPRQVSPHFAIARSDEETKSRWVDGTPEYSLYICGLHKLFPAAKFVHIVRDVREVVASMLHFEEVGGAALAADADHACEYWVRTVRACLDAEQALGSATVLRVRHADLSAHPRELMQRICTFLDEPFEPACLEPLAKRINSSGSNGAPVDLREGESDHIDAALRLDAELRAPWIESLASACARAAFERYFADRVQFVRTLDMKYEAAKHVVIREREDHERWVAQYAAERAIDVGRLQLLFAWCGYLLAAQLVAAVAVNLYDATMHAWAPASVDTLWLATAAAASAVYIWFRRAGVRRILARVLGRDRK